MFRFNRFELSCSFGQFRRSKLEPGLVNRERTGMEKQYGGCEGNSARALF